MIYTIGHRENYWQAILENGVIFKKGKAADYEGGYAFQSIEDAERMIASLGRKDFAVFGIDADWEADTEPDVHGWWHVLTRDAMIIVLDE